MARGENSGDCPHSSTTRDFEECYSKVLETAEDSLKDFESSIRALMTGPPVRSGTKTICQGLLVRISRPLIDLPNSTRLSVCGTNTRNRPCAAAFHQYDGGTGGPPGELACQIRLVAIISASST